MSVDLKSLDLNLAKFLELACPDAPSWSRLEKEFVCCCERARHAIKDGKYSNSFLHVRDALCDLKWCLDNLYSINFRYGIDTRRLNDLEEKSKRVDKCHDIIRSVSSTLLGAYQLRKPLGPSVYSLDAARNGLGSADLPPGLNLDDFGEIRRSGLLGEGAHGKVYRAIWRGVDPVAVKEVSSDTGSEALQSVSMLFSGTRVSEGRSNLDCELQVLKRLNHPNIVELKGYTRNVSAGKYGLVMELMKCSLKDLITSEEPISKLASVDMLLQVARGMQFLHTIGIMHRDLKPANILIGDLNARGLGYVVAKLADFGLSKQDLTVDGAGWHSNMQGTSFYMAPEIRKSGKDAGESRTDIARYARSADVFSFGTICFNLLTRKEIPLEVGEFYKRIEEGDLDELLYNYGRSKMAFLVTECWCTDPNRRPTFLEICMILEKEKRRMLLENYWQKFLRLLLMFVFVCALIRGVDSTLARS